MVHNPALVVLPMMEWMLISVVATATGIAPLPGYQPLYFRTYLACNEVALEFTPPGKPRIGTRFAICRKLGDEPEDGNGR